MRDPKKNWARWLGVGIAVVVALGAVAAWFRHHETRQGADAPLRGSSGPGAALINSSTNTPDAGSKGLLDRLRSAARQLSASKGGLGGRQLLIDLRQVLLARPGSEAGAAIREFLDSKADAPTGQGFKIGAKGFLENAPTLRTFLLDCLGQVDPASAAAYARTILESKDSPDEWALALRNLALGDTSSPGRALLEQKVGEMLGYEAWQQNPSVGFLEAFDAAVYLGGTNLLPFLAGSVVQQDNPALARAAFLAMDRLVLGDPAGMLGALEAEPSLMQGREQTRANYFARADVRDAQQRQILENYLLDPRISASELAQFAGIFPNANYMISANLLTSCATPNHADLTARDAAALQVVQGWLEDPRFAELRPQLQAVSSRLGEFVRQASGQ